MKRVFLTGASGFVGRRAVSALVARGFDVWTTSRSPIAARSTIGSDVEILRGDLLDAEALPALLRKIAPTHLLHLAWDVTHGSYWTSSENLRWLTASTSLLQHFFECGGERAIGVGSCAEYDWKMTEFREYETILNPMTPYGASKASLFHAYEAASGIGLSTAWARLFFPYGPGEKSGRLIPSIITGLSRGETVPCTAGMQVRDFLYVDDAAEALAALLDSDVQGAVNVGSGVGTSIKDVATRIGNRFKRTELLKFGALPTREGDPRSLIACTNRLSKEVGFVPKVSLDQGLTQTIEDLLRTQSL